tara:strand:- start:3212 stop:3781 length:570 start_codon:yes stop_codon:yes gene_type:complete
VGSGLIHVHDDFLSCYDELRAFADTADYAGEKNPVDGVIYPNINAKIPDAVRSEVIENLSDLLGRKPEKVTMFLRMSPAGVHVPHIAHHDLSMGQFSLMLYLNDHEQGGTGLLRHRRTGMSWAPEDPLFTAVAQADQNNTEAWAITSTAQMKQNRAAIFEAAQFHCALPVGGFGETPKDARTVLTVFFT